MAARKVPSLVPPTVAAGLPLDAARAAFAWLCHGPDPVTIDGRAVAGLPSARVRVDELADLLAEPDCPPPLRDAVWAHLVRRSRAEGGTWTVVCAGAALPALDRVCDRLCRTRPVTLVRGASPASRRRHRRSPTRVEVESAVLVGFLTGLAVTDLRRPGIAARLTDAADQAGREAYRRLRATPTPAPLPVDLLASGWGGAHPDLVLARAVAARAITRSEAVLIGATRLEPGSLAAIAAARGRSLAQIRAARVRAERKLSTYLRTVGRDDGPEPTHHRNTRPPSVTRSRTGSGDRSRLPADAPAPAGTAPAADGRRVGGEGRRVVRRHPTPVPPGAAPETDTTTGARPDGRRRS